MAVSDMQLVLAFFDSESAADQAAATLKDWDQANEGFELGAIGVLVKDADGKVKAHKLGSRETGRGAGIGVILGIVAAILSGGVTLLGGVVGGTVLGAAFGSFFHKGLGISKEDMTRIGAELDAGHAAVGVLAEPGEVDRVTAKLTELGGTPEVHSVTSEALEHAAAATDAGTDEVATPTSGNGADAPADATTSGATSDAATAPEPAAQPGA
jgi:uncharacterized membrane protein